MTEEFTNFLVQIAAAGLGSLGFGIFFRVKGKQLVFGAIGGTLTWTIYLIIEYYMGGIFIPNFIASVFAAIFAERMAVYNRAPATIFLIAAAIPLIPGGPLYYTMAGLVTNDDLLFQTSANKALTVAIAISLGFMLVAILHRYYRMIKRNIKNGAKS